MADYTKYTKQEMQAYAIAKNIKENQIVIVGTGLPLIGASLAKRVVCPSCHPIVESGLMDCSPVEVPRSVGDNRFMAHCAVQWPNIRFIGFEANEWLHDADRLIAFIGGAQIDPYGNVNSTCIYGKGDYVKPQTRFTGSGGAGIVGGMNPKPHVDMEAALAQIEATKGLRADPPGSVSIHFGQTGFFREVYNTQEGVIAGIKKYVDMLPSYDLEFFRVDAPQSPAVSDEELYDLVLNNKNRPYDMYSVIARLFDGSQFMEYKKGYGPEMITGLAKVDGLLVGVVANQQGVFPNYPEYKMEKYGQSMGAGGKLYRQGLIKMNEFVTLCARDRIPMIWIQDTTGIDVGDDAEVAELLGLGQSLIYSIQTSKLPMMEITLRRGTAAAHYVLGGPQGNDNNAFSLGTAATEINVMNGKTAANAMYTGRLAKDQKAGKDLQPTIDKMNALIDDYDVKSKPLFCAQAGLVDEIVDMPMMRNYIVAFTDAVYQNPESICPFHQMLLPRTIRDYDNLKK